VQKVKAAEAADEAKEHSDEVILGKWWDSKESYILLRAGDNDWKGTTYDAIRVHAIRYMLS
jgi:hypothetical protein